MSRPWNQVLPCSSREYADFFRPERSWAVRPAATAMSGGAVQPSSSLSRAIRTDSYPKSSIHSWPHSPAATASATGTGSGSQLPSEAT